MRHFRITRGRPLLRALGIGLSLALLTGLGAQLVAAQATSEQELFERFRLRSEIGSNFLSGYANDLLARELDEARDELRHEKVSARSFNRLAQVFGFPAALLLDARGRVLAVEPPAPQLLGREIASGYQHLVTALDGEASVSNVVPSAVLAEPIVAFAVPFSTPSGRRVFSGTLSIANTTLGSAYLTNLVPLAGSRVYLVDATGATIASSLGAEATADLMRQSDPLLWKEIGSSGEGGYEGTNGRERFAVSPVQGTPWRLVISSPEAVVLAPVSGTGRWVPWLIFGALCATFIALMIMFRQLAKARARRLAEVERLSVTDDLTGLYNRRGHELLSRQILRSAAREGRTVAIVFLDLDGLKRVNDEQGHDAGDRMLVATADLLRRTFRDSDVVARFGGDEFCVVAASPSSSPDQTSILGRLSENIARHNANAPDEPRLSLSVGVSWFDPEHPCSLDELVREADERMYEGKRKRNMQGVS